MITQLENLISTTVTCLSIAGAIGALYWFIKTTMTKKGMLFNLKTKKSYSKIIHSLKKDGEDTPLGMEEFAEHYTKVSHQIKISFWFGLIFALFGLSVLLIITYSETELGFESVIISLISISIIEAVALLFIFKSNKAQKDLEKFFKKLREDKQKDIAKNLVESIEDVTLRDVLRIQLTLFYSGIQKDTSLINEFMEETLKKQFK
jgi:hypothetical protein